MADETSKPKLAVVTDGFPIVQDGGRARGFEIVGERDPLDPLRPAVGDADRPCARGFVAPVAQGNAGADPRPVGFFPHRELAAGASAFEASIARLGHWECGSVSGQCPKYRSGAPWRAKICHDAGRSPLSAPPWRFWAPGAALPSPRAPAAVQRRAFAFGSVQRAPRTQVVVPGGRGSLPPGASGYEPPAAGRHSSLRLQDRLRRRPSMSEDADVLL